MTYTSSYSYEHSLENRVFTSYVILRGNEKLSKIIGLKTRNILFGVFIRGRIE